MNAPIQSETMEQHLETKPKSESTLLDIPQQELKSRNEELNSVATSLLKDQSEKSKFHSTFKNSNLLVKFL